jgi:hypothetical protein
VTGRRISSLDTGAFGALFAGVQRSWFRLETLQGYDVGYERSEYDAFTRGEVPDMTPGPWQEMIASHVAAGRVLARVHVVTEPLTAYLRYELACYPRNAAAGEDIRLIPVRRGTEWPHGVPRHDYWLFDERDVWLMAYDDAGRFLYTEQHNEDLENAIRYRDAALRQSVSLTAYLASERAA